MIAVLAGAVAAVFVLAIVLMRPAIREARRQRELQRHYRSIRRPHGL